MNVIVEILINTWDLLQDASIYILFGLLVSGWLRVFISPQSVAHHFGQGRVRSVLKAALFLSLIHI